MDLSGTTTTAKLTADSTTQSQCIFCGEIHCYSECNLIKITNHVRAHYHLQLFLDIIVVKIILIIVLGT